jgi:hypothetical protein
MRSNDEKEIVKAPEWTKMLKNKNIQVVDGVALSPTLKWKKSKIR